MKINGEDYRTVWFDKETNTVKMINQPLLAEKFEIIDLKDYKEVANAITTMVVRGSPAIGATGAYGLAQAIRQLDAFNLNKIQEIKQTLQDARPTGYDLTHGLNYIFNKVRNETSLENAKTIVLEAAEEYADISVEACKKIGEYGNELIKDNFKILTHCNAGALATVDYGTALAPIRSAHYSGKKIFVFADETRPRLQGARLTAWELAQEKIPHAIIADNAAGHFMQRNEVDIVIVGTDRVAANGDIANKIGTYEKAVVAKENNIPFYIAAPISTIDFDCPSGMQIPIEERDEIEVLEVKGKKIGPLESHARNPAFDVTPAKFITGIITEKGIFKPEELIKLKENV